MEEAKKLSRDQIRTRLLGRKGASTVVVMEDGTEVEVRQPSIGNTLTMAEQTDAKTRMVSMLVKHCFVPGTNDAVFEDTDRDVILGLPAGGDFQRLMDAMNKLMATEDRLKAAEK